MTRTENQKKLIYMISLALLTAIVVFLQLAGVAIPLSFLTTPVSLVLIPIALGAMVLGPAAGAWLGFVCGLVIFITCGPGGQNPFFTGILFQNHPLLTFLVCTVKSTVAGYVAGVVYRVLARKNSLVASFAAAALVPVLNTGIFILGCFTMMDTFEQNFLGGMNMWYYLVVLVAGVNFLAELAINLIFSPALHRVVLVVQKKLGLGFFS